MRRPDSGYQGWSRSNANWAYRHSTSATPFFLRGSGYAEGTLFPWTVSDFSLMDAIQCGIVKLPRIPVADNIASGDMPTFRNLWEAIGKEMPRKGRSKTGQPLDPLKLPVKLQTAPFRVK
jgi:type III restriction enzyme